MKLHWLSRPRHWAEVMARADELETDFDGQAAQEADRERGETPSEAERELLGDVSAELKRRSLHEGQRTPNA